MKQLTFDRERVLKVSELVADKLVGFAERQRARDERRARKVAPRDARQRPPAAQQAELGFEGKQ